MDVIFASDCHTVSARPHLGAMDVISAHPVGILPEAEI
jgi:hypothetical protein